MSILLSLALLLKNIYSWQLHLLKKKVQKFVELCEKYYPSKLTFPNQLNTFTFLHLLSFSLITFVVNFLYFQSN